MSPTSPPQPPSAAQFFDCKALESLQRAKLDRLIGRLKVSNRFYQSFYRDLTFDAQRDSLQQLPFLTRKMLEEDQAAHPPFGTNLTEPVERCVRMNQTSGSSGGRPMRCLDTPESWDWCLRCWTIVFDAAGLTPTDRLFFPFSFGPFLGFWSAYDAARMLGNLAIAGGGMTTTARLSLMCDVGTTVVCCTPTYAMRMADVAKAENVDIARSAVRLIIVAGEPGGSVPEIRQKIESAWNARVFDHWGMSEIGPLGFECPANPGKLHLTESECIAEVINPATGRLLPEGEAGELVITTLGRVQCPVIRYRTGDQVRITRERCSCGRSFALAAGGILGRIDDMIHVRGNNLFPAALEAIILRLDEVAEFLIEAYEAGPLTQIRIVVEPTSAAADDPSLPARVTRAIQNGLSFRAEVKIVAPGTLPRSEMKAKRFIRRKE